MNLYRIIYIFDYAIGERTIDLLPESFLTESAARKFILDEFIDRFERETRAGETEEDKYIFMIDDKTDNDIIKVVVYNYGKLYGTLTLKIA